MEYYVYIMSSTSNYTIYTGVTGVTNNLVRRVYEHRTGADPDGFTTKYAVKKLVYYESTHDVLSAIEREKQIKSWSRKKKNTLIAGINPAWRDLYPELLD